MVATQQQQDEFAFVFAFNHDGFEGLFNRNIQEFNQRLNGFDVWCMYFGQLGLSSSAFAFKWQSRCQFDIGGVIGSVAICNNVFTTFSQYLEFVRAGTADAAGICGNRTEFQTQTGEDTAVSVVHILIGRLKRGIVGMEGISVFHDELARTHHTEARTHFIAEFGLDVVKVFRQLFVAVDFFAHDVGNHFFASRTHTEIAVMTVFQAQQFFTVKLPAAGFLPQFGRLYHRHQQLHATCAGHFFTHDIFNFAQYAQTHRHPSIKTGCVGFDQAGTNHQLVAGKCGFGRGFFKGRNEELGGFHGVFFFLKNKCVL